MLPVKYRGYALVVVAAPGGQFVAQVAPGPWVSPPCPSPHAALALAYAHIDAMLAAIDDAIMATGC